MNIKEKKLALAELMGHHTDCTINTRLAVHNGVDLEYWEPYSETQEGLAQFSAILLKFPEVMYSSRIVDLVSMDNGDIEMLWLNDELPTQADILNEILRMKGKLA